MTIMGNKSHEIPADLCFARAVSASLRRQFPAHTIKTVAGHLGVSPKTAENILNGHLSGGTVSKLILAYGAGWVAERVLEAAGQTLETYIETQAAEAERAATQARERAAEARQLFATYQASRRRGSDDRRTAA